MSQYSEGTVETTAGSQVVIGTDTEWLSNVSENDEFRIQTEGVVYIVASIDSDTQITLSSEYPSTRSGVAYTITHDFTATRGLPLCNSGDRNFPEIYTRAMQLIDIYLNGGVTFSGIVLDKDLTAAPSSGVSDGDSYIVASAPASGDTWFGYTDYIATWNDNGSVSGWTFTAPTSGIYVWVSDENQIYFYDGDAWNLWTVYTGTSPDVVELTFDDGDLNMANVYEAVHNIGRECVAATIWNGASPKEVIYPDNIQSNGVNQTDIDLTSARAAGGGSISGTWTIILI